MRNERCVLSVRNLSLQSRIRVDKLQEFGGSLDIADITKTGNECSIARDGRHDVERHHLLKRVQCQL